MGDRYYITGVQLGIIKALSDKQPEQVIELIKKIEEEQYICKAEEFNKKFIFTNKNERVKRDS